MDNTVWWPVVVAFHALLFLVLLRFRRIDHPWLLPLYGVVWTGDLVAFLLMPPIYGGREILAPWSEQGLVRGFVFYVSYAAWLASWVLPAMAAEALFRARVSRLWWSLLVVAAAALAAATWAVQAGALERSVVLAAMHYAVEPLLLGRALYFVIRYIVRCCREAQSIDLLALALMLEITNLTLKLLFALRPGLSVDQSFSALYHVICLVGFFGYYALEKARTARRPTPS